MGTTDQPFDVAIAGGGLVGMSLAAALGGAGVATVLVEADAGERAPTGFDARPIALSQGSRRILQTLGAWEEIAAAVTPITSIHVSDRGHFGFARLQADDHGVDATRSDATPSLYRREAMRCR